MPKPISNNHMDDVKPTATPGPKKRGWDEIEQLLNNKKEAKKTTTKKLPEEAAKRTQEHEQQQTKKKTKNTAMVKSSHIKQPTNTRTPTDASSSWVEDGLGGRFNNEGFTGRVEDGVKIFKAHVLSKPNAGNTPDCPFDCDCCFI